MHKDITADIRYLKGIGPQRAKLFNALGINCVEDMFYYFPRRYQDRSLLSSVAGLKPGEYQTVKARIARVCERPSRGQRPLRIFEAVIEDSTGRVPCVWFNQPYLRNYLSPGKELLIYGKADNYGDKLQMQNPEYEIISDDSADTSDYARIVPVYSLAGRLSQRMFRRLVKSCLDEYLGSLSDALPYDIRQRNSLLNIASSILNMHFPQSAALQEAAYKRIIFEECFLMQLVFGLKRLKADEIRGISHRLDEDFLSKFENGLSFGLTVSQKKVIQEIRKDMASPRPMQRLLQGDVGSGKTVVAVYACMIALSCGYQAAFMVPTEILAQQHYQSIGHLVSAAEYHGCLPRVELLTGSLNKKEKRKIYDKLKDGEIDILIGTHALVQEGLDFKNLSLVIIDEQHKFGVHQRLSMLTKGKNPDCLVMTATPIPRTLALTIYSDLNISTIEELPAGRIAVKTYLVNESKRQWVYAFLREKMSSGRQGYIVYPIIDESQELELRAAAVMYEDLRKNVFGDFRVGLLHGRHKSKERSAVMRAFRSAEIDLLVSTVVIEVGIDVGNASVMVIEHAERFGLSQLHQLRGRIGRAGFESYCILMSDSDSRESRERLRVMVDEADGFRIAQRDLEIRGPGEFFGVRQHGIPELRINPLKNLESIDIARKEARDLLVNDPSLSLRQNFQLVSILKRRFPEYDKLLKT